jgi:hypothetical protein
VLGFVFRRIRLSRNNLNPLMLKIGAGRVAEALPNEATTRMTESLTTFRFTLQTYELVRA